MNWKKGMWYLLYACIFFLILYLVQEANAYLNTQMRMTFHLLPYINLTRLFLILPGLVLGLEHFVQEWRKEGRWVINIWKLLFLALPMAFFTFLMQITNIFTIKIPVFLFNILGVGSLAAVFLGYFILTSFYKEEQQK